jgi:hypothetical protein
MKRAGVIAVCIGLSACAQQPAPAWWNTPAFPITTNPVADDIRVTLIARLEDKSFLTAFTVWYLGENDLSFEIRPAGVIGHYTSRSANFTALCSGSTFQMAVDRDGWIVALSTATNSPLRPGSYTAGFFGPGPVILIRSSLTAMPVCPFQTGQFTIHDMDLPPRGPVRRFIASAEQVCRDGSSVRVEMRLLNPQSWVVPQSLQGCTQ